eukprot:2136853-Rhodomonas_salina.1
MQCNDSPTKVKAGKTHPDSPSWTTGAKSVTFSAPGLDVMKELNHICTLVTHAPPSGCKHKQDPKGGGGNCNVKKSKRMAGVLVLPLQAPRCSGGQVLQAGRRPPGGTREAEQRQQGAAP